MIKAKNYIPHTTCHENGTETASRNPSHKDGNLLRGWTLSSWGTCTLPRCKTKGLKKKKANNTKVMSACAEAVQALVKHNEVKPKLPKGGSYLFHQHSCITHPKLNTPARITLPRVSGFAGQRPMVGLKAQAAAATLALAPRGAQAPMRTRV
ncbi:60S ribosomal protein L29-like [Meles meles]|uniref:60S ribosomal protein L29-like n=1 Tax=Meles meles TaxID=9662 RepID=UPI001E69D7F3|nr:60S ribosomal protein L29-like [Meles meles]